MFTWFRQLCILISMLAFWLPFSVSASEGRVQDVVVLCYHDVGQLKNEYSVTKETLVMHLSLLKKFGFQPISAEQYLKAKQGKGPLPEKPVMLTFDDGYASFYKEVFPLLKQFQYPAVLGLVTSWQEFGSPQDVGASVSWEQVKEMEASGLVTMGSHSNDLHNFIAANPFGDRGQAASTLLYREQGYETPENYQKRISMDMELTQHVFQSNLGHSATVYVWPYGEYTQVAAEAAKSSGFELLFTLGNDVFTETHRKLGVNRTIIYGNPGEQKFLQLLPINPVSSVPLKVGQLDIDLLYDESPAQLEENIDAAISLLKRSGVNTVFLQAFVDDKGTGNIEYVYFHTTVAPVKKDIFSHVVQRLQNEKLRVYAWMPTLACQWLLKDHIEDTVQASDMKKQGWYNRATPFSPRVSGELKALFRDLAAYSSIDGVLFQDDLYLNDFEDMSPAAKSVFKEHFHQELTSSILENLEIRQEWTNVKTKALNDLTLELMDEVRKYRPRAKVARNIYPNLVITPEAKEWMAQDYEEYLRLYDYTVIMAYPFMEKVSDPNQWLEKVTKIALSKPEAAGKTILKLQSYDWEGRKWISHGALEQELKILKRNGAINIAYYPLNIYSTKNEPLLF